MKTLLVFAACVGLGIPAPLEPDLSSVVAGLDGDATNDDEAVNVTTIEDHDGVVGPFGFGPSLPTMIFDVGSEDNVTTGRPWFGNTFPFFTDIPSIFGGDPTEKDNTTSPTARSWFGNTFPFFADIPSIFGGDPTGRDNTTSPTARPWFGNPFTLPDLSPIFGGLGSRRPIGKGNATAGRRPGAGTRLGPFPFPDLSLIFGGLGREAMNNDEEDGMTAATGQCGFLCRIFGRVQERLDASLEKAVRKVKDRLDVEEDPNCGLLCAVFGHVNKRIEKGLKSVFDVPGRTGDGV